MKQDELKSIMALLVFLYLPGIDLVANFTNYEELASGLLFISMGIIFSYDRFVLDSKIINTFADYI